MSSLSKWDKTLRVQLICTVVAFGAANVDLANYNLYPIVIAAAVILFSAVLVLAFRSWKSLDKTGKILSAICVVLALWQLPDLLLRRVAFLFPQH